MSYLPFSSSSNGTGTSGQPNAVILKLAATTTLTSNRFITLSSSDQDASIVCVGGLLAAPAGSLTGTTLASNVVTTSITTVGALNSGSITSGFGSIDVGADSITGGAGSFTTLSASGAISGTTVSATTSISLSLAGPAILSVTNSSGVNGTGVINASGNAINIGSSTNNTVNLWHNSVSVGQLLSTGLNSTNIGATTPGTGAFTTLSATGVVGSDRVVGWLTGGSNRWYLFLPGGTESGSNAGSNLTLSRFSDAGSYLGDVVQFTRSSGVPLWTEHNNIFRYNSIGVTSSDVIQAVNATAATISLNQWSPAIHLQGDGWKTTGATRLQAHWKMEVQTTTGTTEPTNELVFSADTSDTPSYVAKIRFNKNGNLTVSGQLTTDGGLQTFGAADSGGAGFRLVLVPN